jgi:hypothetical protein
LEVARLIYGIIDFEEEDNNGVDKGTNDKEIIDDEKNAKYKILQLANEDEMDIRGVIGRAQSRLFGGSDYNGEKMKGTFEKLLVKQKMSKNLQRKTNQTSVINKSKTDMEKKKNTKKVKDKNLNIEHEDDKKTVIEHSADSHDGDGYHIRGLSIDSEDEEAGMLSLFQSMPQGSALPPTHLTTNAPDDNSTTSLPEKDGGENDQTDQIKNNDTVHVRAGLSKKLDQLKEIYLCMSGILV